MKLKFDKDEKKFLKKLYFKALDELRYLEKFERTNTLPEGLTKEKFNDIISGIRNDIKILEKNID